MITIADIIEITARHYGVPVAEILSPRRFYLITEARHVAMYVSAEMRHEFFIPMTLSQIGKAFCRHHSSVIHALQRIENEMPSSHRIADAMEAVREKVVTRGNA